MDHHGGWLGCLHGSPDTWDVLRGYGGSHDVGHCHSSMCIMDGDRLRNRNERDAAVMHEPILHDSDESALVGPNGIVTQHVRHKCSTIRFNSIGDD